jgi:hypothetical protein
MNDGLKTSKAIKAAAKQARLKAALRANLVRRKAVKDNNARQIGPDLQDPTE